MERLHKKREGQVGRSRLQIFEILDDGKPRRRNLVEGQSLLRPGFVEAERQGERITAGLGNSEKLADRRDVRLTIHSAESLGDVEVDVRSALAKALRKILRRLESNDFSEA